MAAHPSLARQMTTLDRRSQRGATGCSMKRVLKLIGPIFGSHTLLFGDDVQVGAAVAYDFE